MGLYAITDRGGEETSAIKWTKDKEDVLLNDEEDSDDVLLNDEEENDKEMEKDEKKKKKDKKDPSLSRSTKVLIGTAATAVVGGVGAVALAPVVLGAVGFTSAGIAAGSYAASMMSAAAVANGGGVAAGSLVAILQSAGAAGLSGFATAAVASTGATVTGLLGGLFGRKVIKETDEEKNKDKK